MRKILEDIYGGRFSAVNRPLRRGSEYDRAIPEVMRCEEALRGKLNPEERKLLESYAQACANLNGLGTFLPHRRRKPLRQRVSQGISRNRMIAKAFFHTKNPAQRAKGAVCAS